MNIQEYYLKNKSNIGLFLLALIITITLLYLYKTYIAENFYVPLTNNSMLSNGFLFKNKNKYIFKLNLPNARSGSYINEDGKYIVKASIKSDDNIAIKNIGELKRTSDGWYNLEYISDEKINYYEVIFVTTLGKEFIVFDQYTNL